MKKDLYEIIGSKRGASAKAIRNRGRLAASQAHPDRHLGEPDAESRFKDIMLARRVLEDPAARRRYDETGEFDDGPDNSTALLVGTLYHLYQTVIHALGNRGVKLTQADIVALMRTQAKGDMENERAQIKTGTELLKRMEQMLGRFSTGDAENFFDQFIRQDMEPVEKQLADHKQKLALLERTEAFLKHCKFRQDAPDQPNDMMGLLNRYSAVKIVFNNSTGS